MPATWTTQPSNQSWIYNRTAQYDVSALVTGAVSFSLNGAVAGMSISDAGVITYVGNETNPSVLTVTIDAWDGPGQTGANTTSNSFTVYMDLPYQATTAVHINSKTV